MALPDRRGCCGTSRRTFLQDTGLGFTGLALSAMLVRDGYAADEVVRPDGQPHFAPKAKAVIWIFLCGGVSHMESFDIKPALTKYAGKSVDETPYKDLFQQDKLLKGLVGINPSHVTARS